MKTKRVISWVFAIIGLALAGCIVPSVYPFYTEKDLTFDSALLGAWVANHHSPDDTETWTFEKDGDQSYKFTMKSKSDTNIFSAHLFTLKGHLFMDCQLQQPNGDSIPPHYLLLVSQISPTLKMSTLKSDWLRDYLAKHPHAIRHTMTADNPWDTNTIHIVLTAETKALQKFILKNLDNKEAFDDVGEKVRP